MTAMGRSAVAVAKWALSTIVSVRYSEVRPCASLAAPVTKTARARARATACWVTARTHEPQERAQPQERISYILSARENTRIFTGREYSQPKQRQMSYIAAVGNDHAGRQ